MQEMENSSWSGMTYRAGEDLAMVLPLPTPPGVKEDAVQFVDLHGYPKFFDHLSNGFPEPPVTGGILTRARNMPAARAPLAVVEVGSFEASFVPTVKDFSRLDPRFRMPEGIWDKLPQYKQAGFAVFKLRKTSPACIRWRLCFRAPMRRSCFSDGAHPRRQSPQHRPFRSHPVLSGLAKITAKHGVGMNRRSLPVRSWWCPKAKGSSTVNPTATKIP